jgi:hypothetical protein
VAADTETTEVPNPVPVLEQEVQLTSQHSSVQIGKAGGQKYNRSKHTFKSIKEPLPTGQAGEDDARFALVAAEVCSLQ